MSEMEKNKETLPPPQHLETSSALESTGESGAPQMAEIEQNSKISPPQQTREMKLSLRSTTRPRADWVNTLWADVSGQLRRLSVISNDLFDGLLLKRYTPTGSLILTELRKQYEQLGDDRNLATVRVLAPEKPMGELWQLYWTIQRHRDPNGRQFHSEMTIDPIDHRSHLELETNPGQPHSVAEFPLPLFIQDYGPGPSEFDPEPENSINPMTQGTVTDAKAGTSVEEESEADGTREGYSHATVDEITE